MPTAIVTGASRGLGFELTRALLREGRRVVIDARGARELEAAERDLSELGDVVAIRGSVVDADHRARLVEAAGADLDLLVNNASVLGSSPQPPLADYRVNVVAPLALAQLAIPRLPAGGRILNVTSDAAVEPYPGWGGYGSSKAALEQLTAILAAEHEHLRIYAVDPGDMRTRMHQDAFPGEDISDRPEPAEVVPALLALIEGERASGRYRAAELAAEAGRLAAAGGGAA
jgi:NAD(P)-dependent dehydrogenase (short-subunit alcohol dehydrogenase family)